ncbi:MAG: hypothetical protein JNM36_05875 [Chitinophagales bacterium]|jgi:hypothetical protein|nr:hypothetical protein [Chitinophagales bacterium]HNI45221.1 hypothetical protein [Chitinophagales bacterium]HNL07966.1 hypothetical protein [Chitinophagales bacterium]
MSKYKFLLFLSLLIAISSTEISCRRKSGCPANDQEAMSKPRKHGKAKKGLFPESYAKKKGLH